MQLERAHYTAKAYYTRIFGLFSRFLFVLLAVAMALAPSTTVIAQQSDETGTLIVRPSMVRADEDDSIRPFRINVPQEAVDDLRRRIAATRWPDQETVADRSQGVQLATMKE